jgi:hypothetical protein
MKKRDHETGCVYPHFFDSEDGGNIFLRNVCIRPEDCTVAQPRAPYMRFTACMHLMKLLIQRQSCMAVRTSVLGECRTNEESDVSVRCISKGSVVLKVWVSSHEEM